MDAGNTGHRGFTMDALFKSTKASVLKSFRWSKHEKMGDHWSDYKHRDKVCDGVVFHVKYLGSILVSELTQESESYGDKIGAEAVKTIVAMAKTSGKKLPMASLTISPNGLCIVNMASEAIISDLDIYRICFCTADRQHERIFAYIARNRENETMECHAFLCAKRKIAEAIALTVAESFQIAKDVVELETETTATSSFDMSASNVNTMHNNTSIQISSSDNSSFHSSVVQTSPNVECHNRHSSEDLMKFASTAKLSTQRAPSYSEFL